MKLIDWTVDLFPYRLIWNMSLPSIHAAATALNDGDAFPFPFHLNHQAKHAHGELLALTMSSVLSLPSPSS